MDFTKKLNIKDYDLHANNPKKHQEEIIKISPQNKSVSNGINLIYVEALHNVFNKFFFDQNVKKSDFLLLRDYEIKILKNLFKQKRIISNTNKNLSLDRLNQLRSTVPIRKSEDQLKFVIKRCIRHLQDQFLLSIRNRKRRDYQNKDLPIKEYKSNVDFHFYKYYFGKIAHKKKLPIETFFHFKSSKKNTDPTSPGFRLRQSIAFWKLNPEFIARIIDFMDSGFLGSFREFNQKKIELLLTKWDGILDEDGFSKGTKRIIGSLKTRGFKLPWTLGDVGAALDLTRRILVED